MDSVRAKNLAQELNGRAIGNWIAEELIGAGKSAVVFKAKKEDQWAALKVFDPELVERFGEKKQLGRIEREVALIGEQHENLVQILDGGKCSTTKHLYVAMEYIKAPNLSDSLSLVPREKIASIVQQIANAARFLESKRLAHRDIKPENIVILPDFSRAVLLDLGVIRPFGEPGLTDDDHRVFIGTLRYSSPEYLIRDELDDPEGWRALTFYQLGAVLHDLIMRKPLFEEFSNPYAVLVEAVKREIPELYSTDVPEELVLLAKRCLVKQPDARIKLVSWNDFEFSTIEANTRDSIRERVKHRQAVRRASVGSTEFLEVSQKQVISSFYEKIENIVRHECVGESSFPPFEIVCSNDSIRLDVVFSQSAACGLSLPVSFVFEGELLDKNSQAFIVRNSFCIGDIRGLDFNERLSTEIFKGPVATDIFSHSVTKLLWIGMDHAQLESEKHCNSKWIRLCLD